MATLNSPEGSGWVSKRSHGKITVRTKTVSLLVGVVLLLSGCLDRQMDEPESPHGSEKFPDGSHPGGAEATAENRGDDGDDPATTEYQPRVIVGVPDLGLNPYHERFFRPNLTDHPCTYLEGFPCDIERLPLSVGGDDYESAIEADEDILAGVLEGVWYWIPRTVFVAVTCQHPGFGAHDPVGPCLLGGRQNTSESRHATGTISGVLTENPGALIAFAANDPSIQIFKDKGIPVDVHSVSWGHPIPIPSPSSDLCLRWENAPLYIKSAGNDPYSSLADCWNGYPGTIIVGGGYPSANGMPEQEQSNSAKNPDLVSYYCRPVAKGDAIDGTVERCGTSYAAPTVAGSLSKVILGLREVSGYTGGLEDGYVDPLLRITINDLRDAMNRTASYTPDAQYPSHPGVPLNTVAPWLQWGWGFYDGLVANVTLAYLLGFEDVLEKPEAARLYMEAVYAARTVLYG